MNQRETFVLKLLRIHEEQGWRLSINLRNIKSDEAHTFSSAEELAMYLARETPQEPARDTTNKQQE